MMNQPHWDECCSEGERYLEVMTPPFGAVQPIKKKEQQLERINNNLLLLIVLLCLSAVLIYQYFRLSH